MEEDPGKNLLPMHPSPFGMYYGEVDLKHVRPGAVRELVEKVGELIAGVEKQLAVVKWLQDKQVFGSKEEYHTLLDNRDYLEEYIKYLNEEIDRIAEYFCGKGYSGLAAACYGRSLEDTIDL